MNGTMPATVNSSVGSSDTSDAEGTTVCPCSRSSRGAAGDLGGLHSGGLGPSVELRVGLAAGGREVSRSAAWGTATGQLDLAAVGQGGVQAGAGAQLVLPDGGGGADVGTEVADRLGQLAQAVGERPGDALRGQLLSGPGEPAGRRGRRW